MRVVRASEHRYSPPRRALSPGAHWSWPLHPLLLRASRALLAAALLLPACHAAPSAANPTDAPPADLFPAPPGFSVSRPAPDTWCFTGEGRETEGAAFFRVSCVELFGWHPCDERREAGGAYRLAFTRREARLDVHVAGSDGTLVCTVRVGGTAAAPAPVESARGADPEAAATVRR